MQAYHQYGMSSRPAL